MGKRIRLFIAVDVGQSIRDRCIAMQETLAETGVEVKWVEPSNLHITLLFLGEIADRDLPVVCETVEDACEGHDSFHLSVEGIGCFPNPRRPKIVWAGVTEGEEELRALHASLEEPLLELGHYRREARQYTPHLTLGRVKGDHDPEPLVEAIEAQSEWAAGHLDIREVHVMSSQLTTKGPIYSILSRASLG